MRVDRCHDLSSAGRHGAPHSRERRQCRTDRADVMSDSPSQPRELFNEDGDVFDAEIGTLLDAFTQLDNGSRKSYRDHNAEFVATRTARRILVVAGPGAGKSFLFLRRIRHWLESDGKAKVYVSSFVRKLVKDLQNDVATKLGEADRARVTVSTLHGLARSILERSRGPAEHKRQSHTNILTDAWMELVWSDVRAFHDGLPTSYSTKFVTHQFHTEQLDSSGEWPALLVTYERLASFYNSVGFADLIVMAREAVDERPDLVDHTYWIIDEYQDFNASEDHLIRSLTSSADGVLIAGDDEQALYQGLKQSLPEIITSYYQGSEFANAMLPFCSRCGYWICQAASAFIAENRANSAIKKIYLPLSVEETEPKVQMIATPTPGSEVDYIQKFISDHQDELDEHVERMKSGDETDPFLLILTPDKKLKLLKTQGADIELKEWLSQWSVVSTGHSDDYRRIQTYCAAVGLQADNWVLRRVLHYEGQTVAQVHTLIESALQSSYRLAEVESDVISAALAKCAQVSALVDRSDLTTVEKVHAIGQLIAIVNPSVVAEELEASPLSGGIFAVEDEAEEAIETAGASAPVELLTLVGSKGLSARHVIVLGCDNVNLNYMSRLAFFVAMTRARKSLHLIVSAQSRGGQTSHAFLDDIPDELCDFLSYKKTGRSLTHIGGRKAWKQQIARWVPRQR